MKAVVTGASRGLGREIARALASAGYDLLIAARDSNALNKVASDLSAQYAIHVETFCYDLSIKDQCAAFVKGILSGPSPQVLVNNLGAYSGSGYLKEDLSLLEEMMAVNLFPAHHISKAVGAEMAKNKSGHIFNICSVASVAVKSDSAAYSVSKAALLSLSRVMSQELRNFGVKVTAIIPGAINTSSWEGEAAPVEQFVQPEDISSTILHLLRLSKNCVADEVVLNPITFGR